MKLKTQEKIRCLELYSYIIIALSNSLLFKDSNIDFINNLEGIMGNIYMLDLITNFKTQTFTKEYKELKKLYNTILEKTVNLYNNMGLNDPISIFCCLCFYV